MTSLLPRTLPGGERGRPDTNNQKGHDAMLSRFIRATAAAAIMLFASAGQAASLYLTPGSIAPVAFPSTPSFFNVVLDLENVISQGGGAEFDFSGVIGFTAFSASQEFDDLIQAGFSGYNTSNVPSGAELEIWVGDFSGITGVIQLGMITTLVQPGAPGAISVTASPSTRYDTFLDMNGDPIPGFTYSGATVVPLPATAWLFATGFGIAGIWRRRRR